MPPVLGPPSPSSRRLKSCAGTSGTHRRPVGDGEQRHLGAVEVLLDQDRAPGVEHRAPVGDGGVAVGGDEHALARGQPVVLDDVRAPGSPPRPRPAPSPARPARRPARPGRSARRPRSSRAWRRTCCPPAGRPAPTGRSRRCRRPGRRRPHRRPAAPRGRRRRGRRATPAPARRPRPGSADVDRERLGDRAGAGVAGRAGERAHRGVGGQSHAQGVLPGTGADHEHAHGGESTERRGSTRIRLGCSRTAR